MFLFPQVGTGGSWAEIVFGLEASVQPQPFSGAGPGPGLAV